MAKRAKLTSSQLSPALSDFTAIKPQAEAPKDDGKPENVPQGEDRTGTRTNTRGQTLRLNEDAWAQLKYLAIDQRRPAHALLVEAVNELFKKYGKPPIA